MNNLAAPDPDPPADEHTLREWLADSRQDWVHTQSTLWLPRVPPELSRPARPHTPAGMPGTESRLAGHRLARWATAQPASSGPAPAARSRPTPPRRCWLALTGAVAAIGFTLTPATLMPPMLTGALAVLAGVGSAAVATTAVVHAITTTTSTATAGKALPWTAMLLAAAAIGLGGSTLLDATSPHPTAWTSPPSPAPAATPPQPPPSTLPPAARLDTTINPLGNPLTRTTHRRHSPPSATPEATTPTRHPPGCRPGPPHGCPG